MDKIPFDIEKITVSEQSLASFTFDVKLKSGKHFTRIFNDESKYIEALSCDGNLTMLKEIFSDWIEEFLDENPDYQYFYTNSELFDMSLQQILQDPPEERYKDAIDLLRSCAVEKEIEFDGYLEQRWKESADTIISFDAQYFDDLDKMELFVFLAAAVDPEIYSNLEEIYRLVLNQPLSHEMVHQKITYLTKEKGVKF